ncbi:hypothetical protein FHS18_006314 [Paenibacillus phyllosphaerae]|uniref:DUF5060 domain-containing protein n=1 Tax=Paenibacillus phyllosphaerae TaxID=274593 RepID=A0A7W5B5A0_9BACL|nr:DUF5605 domain-containing protein [Paenibacillus phyllosphaerae]MBB3114196.1 hypothetical protein [Paenibacillus phyllosphaerae]
MVFNENSKIGKIWRNEEARAVLSKHMPALADNPYTLSLPKMLTVPQFASFSKRSLGWPEGKLQEVMNELAQIVDPPEQEPVIFADDRYGEWQGETDSVTMNAPAKAEKWGVYEIHLTGPRHGNPFADVQLAASFYKDGRSVQATGFYDGEGIYKIRFMADEEGAWTFKTRSSYAGLDGLEGQFACKSAEAGNHGPVQVRHTYHFGYADGTPYIPVGTTSYAWTHQGDELEEQTLASLAGSPFNKLRMCVFPKSYLYNMNEPVHYPYEGSLEQGWDYSRFNPAFFQHLERRIEDLGRLGIEVDLILFHPYDRWGFAEMSPSQDDFYLRYIVARLSAYRHIWWSLANEYDFMWAKGAEDWERFGGIVTSMDPYGHLISNHNGMVFYDFNKPWVTHCSIQRVDVYKTAEATNEWRERWKKPIVIDECAYEGNIDQGWGNISGEEMVRRFWEGAVRGGYVAHGETYMDPDDIIWWAKGGKLHGSSPERIAFLRGIMEAGPKGGLDPLRFEWDLPCAGVEDEYYLFYFGFNQPKFREFQMKPGIEYQVEVIDTWNMTVERLEGTYEGKFRIELPGRQYMAVRMTAVE